MAQVGATAVLPIPYPSPRCWGSPGVPAGPGAVLEPGGTLALPPSSSQGGWWSPRRRRCPRATARSGGLQGSWGAWSPAAQVRARAGSAGTRQTAWQTPAVLPELGRDPPDTWGLRWRWLGRHRRWRCRSHPSSAWGAPKGAARGVGSGARPHRPAMCARRGLAGEEGEGGGGGGGGVRRLAGRPRRRSCAGGAPPGWHLPPRRWHAGLRGRLQTGAAVPGGAGLWHAARLPHAALATAGPDPGRRRRLRVLLPDAAQPASTGGRG